MFCSLCHPILWYLPYLNIHTAPSTLHFQADKQSFMLEEGQLSLTQTFGFLTLCDLFNISQAKMKFWWSHLACSSGYNYTISDKHEVFVQVSQPQRCHWEKCLGLEGLKAIERLQWGPASINVLLATSVLRTNYSGNLGLSPLLKILTQGEFRKPKLEANWLEIKQ